MGLRKDDTARGGLQVTDAYHRIAYTRGDPKKVGGYSVFVNSYKDKAQSDAGGEFFARREITGLTFDAVGNPMAKLYADVKSHAEETFFSDAEDVIE